MGWTTRVQFPPGTMMRFFLVATFFTPEVKQPGHEVDHSPPSNAKVKNVWSYTSAPPVSLHGMVLC